MQIAEAYFLETAFEDGYVAYSPVMEFIQPIDLNILLTLKVTASCTCYGQVL